jgi:cell division protease FtsH
VPLRNRLKLWGRRLLIVALIYGIYSGLFHLFVTVAGVTCADPATGEAVRCTQAHAHALAPRLLFQGLNFAMYFLFLAGLIIFQMVALFWFMSRGRSYTIFPGEYDVSFDDVRGQKPVVESVQEVVKLFRGFRDFRKLGGYPPHGILFEGPPGTGKTLMAKAVAGTVGVPFIYTPATGFSNMFIGIGALRVWSLFRKAKKFSRKYDGAVIFIDEIDAIGSRGGGAATAFAPSAAGRWAHIIMGGMGAGAGQGVTNELLVQMDGLVMPKGMFSRHLRRLLRRKPKIPSYNVLIIGATNRAQDLDPALLRPGRFDRKIHVGLPDKEGRKDIIQYYLAKVRHAPLDLDKFAQVTIHYSPARIKNIINEALIFAHQAGRDALNWEDIWQAKLIDEIGLKQHVKYTDREKTMTAVHEAGHAVASRELQGKEKQIQIISIVKRETSLGVVHWVDLEEKFSETKEEILDEIKVFLAGQAAEEIWFSTSTTGPSNDLYWATILALNYVGRFGMGKRLVSYSVVPRSMWGEMQTYEKMLDDNEIRDEIDTILKRCKAEVSALLKRRSFAVERIRDELLEREELIGDQLEAVMREISEQIAASTPYEPVPPPR